MALPRLSILALCLFAVACKSGVPDAETAARINGETITKKDFQEQVERNMARYRGQSHQLPPGIEARIQESVLRRMIDDEIVAQKARGLKIAVSDQEIDAKFKEHKERFRTDRAFDDYLKRSNNTEANMKDDLKRSMLRDRVVDQLSGAVEVNDAEVQKYYTENGERFRDKEQVRASRLVVKMTTDASAGEKKAALREAKRLQALAAKPGADFGALAHEHSKGPEQARNGELGWIARGRMPPEFDAAAFALKAGAVSDVIETKLGYEIIKVDEVKPEHLRPLEEVKENIKNALIARLRNQKRRDVMQALKNEAKVEQLIKFDVPAAPPGTPQSLLGGAPPPWVQPAGATPAAAAPAPAAAAAAAAPAPAPAPAPAAAPTAP